MLGGGPKIGRLFGVDIHLDWSLIFIFVLVTWSLGAGFFPQVHPGWSTVLTWSMSLLAAVLFFSSVLAHELSHAIVAAANGLPVRRITLFIFGGVADIQREPPSAKAEFQIAIIGPITSVAIGIVCLTLGGLLSGGLSMGQDPMALWSDLGPLPTLLFWLGSVNIVLGVFNMAPGFPLDGGRVLRSILWTVTGSLQRATRLASWAGQGFAWLLIMTGIAMVFGAQVPFFGSGTINGLWLAFIGWFLNNAAVQSYKQLVVRDLLEGVPVSRLMRTGLASAAPDLTIEQLVDDFILHADQRAVPVVEGEQLVGLVCLEDLRGLPRDRWSERTVSEIMTPAEELETVSQDTDTAEALQKLARRDVEQLPVMHDGRMVGLVRQRDILTWLELRQDAPQVVPA